MEEIIAEGDFEVDLTFGPSLDVLSVAGLGCDIAEGVCVSAELTGDEGGRDPDPLLEVKPSNPNVWHVCKELSCLQGEIDALGKLEAWFQLGGHVWSADYELFRAKALRLPLLLYLQRIQNGAMSALSLSGSRTRPGTGVAKENPDGGRNRHLYGGPALLPTEGAKAYIEGVTDKDGYVHLYMPAADDPEKDNVQITATSWQGDPDDPQQKVKKTVEYAR